MFNKLWLPLLSLFVLNGCASPETDVYPNIHSKNDVSNVKALDRVLISISLKRTFFREQEIAQSLSNSLTKHGVAVQTIVLKTNPLELERGKDLKVAILAFKPNQVLELTVTNAREENGVAVFFVLEGRLYDAVTKFQVWHFSYIGSHARLDSNTFVDAVVQKLEADGLLLPLNRKPI